MKWVLMIAAALIIAGVALFFSIDINQSLFLFINALFPNRYFWTAITTIGDGAVAGCIFYILLRKNNDALAKGFIAALVGLLASDGLKNFFAVPRPEHTVGFDHPVHFLAEPIATTSFSMPSGHTLAAFLLGSLLFQYLKLNFLAKVFIGLLLVAVGISRIALGVHWPADVLAGAGLGIFIANISSLLPLEIKNRKVIIVAHLLYITFIVALVHKYLL